MAWLKAKLVWICETLWDAFFNNEPPRAPRVLRRPVRRKRLKL
jgi:hypothetical protein